MSLIKITANKIGHSPTPNPDIVFVQEDYSKEVWQKLLALCDGTEIDVTNVNEDETIQELIQTAQTNGEYVREYSEKNSKGGKRIVRELWVSDAAMLIRSRTYPNKLEVKDYNWCPKIKTSLVYNG